MQPDTIHHIPQIDRQQHNYDSNNVNSDADRRRRPHNEQTDTPNIDIRQETRRRRQIRHENEILLNQALRYLVPRLLLLFDDETDDRD